MPSELHGVIFTENGATYRPGNGHTIHYRKVGGIFYHADTPNAVINAIEQARSRRLRIRICYGDARTGRDWLEENDIEGTIGNSMGPLKVPLLIGNIRAHGGPALLDQCIVAIQSTGKEGHVLYRHPSYHVGTFAIREIALAEISHGQNLRGLGFTHTVEVDGQAHGRFRSLSAAERYVRKMTL